MDIIELQCLKIVPDIVHEYSSEIKQNQIPLVIDNGMYQNWLVDKILNWWFSRVKQIEFAHIFLRFVRMPCWLGIKWESHNGIP